MPYAYRMGVHMENDENMKEKPRSEGRKAELIAGLRDVRERILSLASSLGPSQQEEPYLGTWSSREMLAHLAGWDDTNIRAADEILSGCPPSFYGQFDKDWAAYNDRLVREYSRDDFEELVSLVRETHRTLIALIEELPAEELWVDRGIRARGWVVTIGRLLEVERQDEEEHYAQLKQFIEDGVKS